MNRAISENCCASRCYNNVNRFTEWNDLDEFKGWKSQRSTKNRANTVKIMLERMPANCKLHRIFCEVIFLVTYILLQQAIISSNRSNYSLDFRHSWCIVKIHNLHNYFDNYDNDLRKKLNLSVSLSRIFKIAGNSKTWNFCWQKKEEISLLIKIMTKQCWPLCLFSTCFS